MRRGLLIAVVAIGVSGCGGAKHVTLPGPSASPQEIVSAYIAALNAHDVTTARALLTPDHARVVGRAVDGWFTNTVSIKNLQMNKPHNDPYDARQRHFRYCDVMGVSFDLEQRHAMSMPNGTTTWGYILCRNSPSKRWLIADEGTG